MATNPIGGESASVTLPGAIAVPAVAQMMLCAPVDPASEFNTILAEYRTAYRNYVTAPEGVADDLYGNEYDRALGCLLETQPPTPDAFVQKYIALWRQGGCDWDLIEDAKRLAA